MAGQGPGSPPVLHGARSGSGTEQGGWGKASAQAGHGWAGAQRREPGRQPSPRELRDWWAGRSHRPHAGHQGWKACLEGAGSLGCCRMSHAKWG